VAPQVGVRPKSEALARRGHLLLRAAGERIGVRAGLLHELVGDASPEGHLLERHLRGLDHGVATVLHVRRLAVEAAALVHPELHGDDRLIALGGDVLAVLANELEQREVVIELPDDPRQVLLLEEIRQRGGRCAGHCVPPSERLRSPPPAYCCAARIAWATSFSMSSQRGVPRAAGLFIGTRTPDRVPFTRRFFPRLLAVSTFVVSAKRSRAIFCTTASSGS